MRFVDETGPLRRLALFRALTGVLLLRHTLPFLENLRFRFFADTFYAPYVAWLPVPDRTGYVALLVATCVAGVFKDPVDRDHLGVGRDRADQA